MSIQDKLKEYSRLKNLVKETSALAKLYQAEANFVKAEIANYSAEKNYGLHIGDVISFSNRGKKATIKITSFETYLWDEGKLDEHPTIYGVVVLKDGKIGVRSVSWWYHSDKPFEIVEVAK